VIFLPGSWPSIASRLRRKSSPVGLKTTKCTPAAGTAPISSAFSDQANGLSSVLKSARTGIAVPLGNTVPSCPTTSPGRREVVWIDALCPI
jgi:hypothetical protein